MKTNRLTHADHEGKQRIALYSERDPVSGDCVRRLSGFRWSRTLKACVICQKLVDNATYIVKITQIGLAARWVQLKNFWK
jgi:hypothetical protein